MMGVLLKLAFVVFVLSMLSSVVDAAPRKFGGTQKTVLTPRQTKTLEKMFMMYGRSFDFERKHGIKGRNYLCVIAKSCDSRRKRDDTTSKKINEQCDKASVLLTNNIYIEQMFSN